MARATTKTFRDIDLNRLLGDEFLLNVDQAGLYLGVSASTLNHWRSDGRGPRFVKLCGSTRGAIRYRLAELREYVDRNTFDSVAEADLANAMSRVTCRVNGWDKIHPFIVRGTHFIVDSALADRKTYLDVFLDPYAKLRWLAPGRALEWPWFRNEKRLELCGAYLNSNSGRGKQVAIEQAYARNLGKIPEHLWGGHPDLTLSRLAKTAGGGNYPIEFSDDYPNISG